MAPSPFPADSLVDRLAQVLDQRACWWFFDIDGTLAEIAPTPAEVRVSPARRELLRRLGDLPGQRITLISGRALSSIETLFPEAHRWGWNLIGVHGGELYPAKADAPISTLSAEQLAAVDRVAGAAAALPRDFHGVAIEAKGSALTVHYRQMDPARLPQLEQSLKRILETEPHLAPHPAKMAWEIRPQPGPTKGKAILELLTQSRGADWSKTVLAVMAGDDVTDEDAFMRLGANGFCIHIGFADDQTAASYTLPAPDALYRFLEQWMARFADSHRL